MCNDTENGAARELREANPSPDGFGAMPSDLTPKVEAKPGPIEVACTHPSVAELEARIAYLRGVNDQLCEACKAIMQASDSGKGVFFARKMAADALARARGGVA